MSIYYVNGQPKDQNAYVLYNDAYWKHIYRERSQFLGDRKVIDYYKYNYFQAFKDVEKQLKNKVSQYKTSTSVRIAMGETCQGTFCFDRSEINADDYYDILNFAKGHMVTEAKTSEVFFPDQTLKLQKIGNIIEQKPIKMRKTIHTLPRLGSRWEQQIVHYETKQMQSVILEIGYDIIGNDEIYGHCLIKLVSNFQYVISDFTLYHNVVRGNQHNSKLKSDKFCVFWTKNSQNLTSYYGEDVVGLPKICSFDPCQMFSSESSESCSSFSSQSSESSESSFSSYSSDSSLSSQSSDSSLSSMNSYSSESSQSSDSSLSSVSSYSSENSFSSQGSTNSENSYSSFNSLSSEVSINSLDSQYSFESSSSNESDSSLSSYSSESSDSSLSSQSSGLKIAYPEKIIYCYYNGSIASYIKFNWNQMTDSQETLVITKEEYDCLSDNQKAGFYPYQFNNYVRCSEDDYFIVYDVVLKQVVYDEYNNIDKMFCRAYDNEGNYIDFQLSDNWQNGFYFGGYECKRQQDWWFMQDGYVDAVGSFEAHIFIYNPTYEAIKPTLS